MQTKAPPVIDFSPFYGCDTSAQERLIQEVRAACEEFGFFQIVNHGIPADLQENIFQQTKEFFALPLEVKQKYDKNIGGYHRGYEPLRAQNFEKRTKGDLKEGYYIGKDLPLDDPYVVEGKFSQGPNKYPQEVRDPQLFREIVDTYHAALADLGQKIFQLLGKTMGLDEGHFKDFCEHPVAVLRLLHYPPQEPDSLELERGIGAHTDFGAVTILLQDAVGGLQVWDRLSSQWVDVAPVDGALVVNLGNMMMRWTNDRYLSNLHRVINNSGQERYSVPFFFSGNPDFEIKCLPTCEDPQTGAKYSPITVGEWMSGRYADTYGASKEKAFAELRTENDPGTV